MDNQRIFVWAALALVLWLNYTTWQRDYAPQAAPVAPAQTQGATQNTPPPDTLPELPSETATSTAPQPKATTAAPEQAVETPDSNAGTVRVVTDVLSIDITK